MNLFKDPNITNFKPTQMHGKNIFKRFHFVINYECKNTLNTPIKKCKRKFHITRGFQL